MIIKSTHKGIWNVAQINDKGIVFLHKGESFHNSFNMTLISKNEKKKKKTWDTEVPVVEETFIGINQGINVSLLCCIYSGMNTGSKYLYKKLGKMFYIISRTSPTLCHKPVSAHINEADAKVVTWADESGLELQGFVVGLHSLLAAISISQRRPQPIPQQVVLYTPTAKKINKKNPLWLSVMDQNNHHSQRLCSYIQPCLIPLSDDLLSFF